MDELETLLEKRLIEKISEGNKPNIAVIFPKSGIVLEDLYGGLGEKRNLYSFYPQPCPINDPEAIRDMLAKLDNMGFDAIALIRGGGKYLEELNSRIVIKACAALSTPLLVAAGHFVDNPLIQHIASKVCGTPTMLGVYLAELTEKLHYCFEESTSKTQKTYFTKISTGSWMKDIKTVSLIFLKWFFYVFVACFTICSISDVEYSDLPLMTSTGFIIVYFYKYIRIRFGLDLPLEDLVDEDYLRYRAKESMREGFLDYYNGNTLTVAGSITPTETEK
jgi:hypothetical protein